MIWWPPIQLYHTDCEELMISLIKGIVFAYSRLIDLPIYTCLMHGIRVLVSWSFTQLFTYFEKIQLSVKKKLKSRLLRVLPRKYDPKHYIDHMDIPSVLQRLPKIIKLLNKHWHRSKYIKVQLSSTSRKRKRKQRDCWVALLQCVHVICSFTNYQAPSKKVLLCSLW